MFQVPGWSVPTALVRQKRKRSGSESNKVNSAEINVEKLMVKLANAQPEVGFNQTRNKSKGPMEPRDTSTMKKKRQKRNPPAEGRATVIDGNNSDRQDTERKEKLRHASVSHSKPFKDRLASERPHAASTSSLTPLQKSMKESLDGARFRLINENLYKSDSHEAHRMMQVDPKVFEEYHTGFRHQVLLWPTNPVEHYISKFALYPPKTIIADLGCGDAVLARDLIPKGLAVISFDLVSDNDFVIEADICDKLPLPGSEGSRTEKTLGEGHIVDVVVCALSLMGLNWLQCLREAWRILKPGGELHITEVASRFLSIEEFESLIGSIGFRFKSKDDSNTHFIMFEFTKVARTSKSEKEWSSILSKGSILKPCEYKRR